MFYTLMRACVCVRIPSVAFRLSLPAIINGRNLYPRSTESIIVTKWCGETGPTIAPERAYNTGERTADFGRRPIRLRHKVLRCFGI